MKRIIILCLLLALLLACVPTPEQEFVVNKGDGVLTQKIADSPAEEKRFDAPSRVDDVIETDGLTVEITQNGEPLEDPPTSYCQRSIAIRSPRPYRKTMTRHGRAVCSKASRTDVSFWYANPKAAKI